MVIRPNSNSPSSLERVSGPATAVLATAAEALQSRLELVLDDRVGPLSSDQRSFLLAAADQGRRLLTTIRDLELVAAASSGSLDAEEQQLDLRALAVHAVESISGLALLRRRPFHVDAPAPAPFVGDPIMLDRAIGALLRRAAEGALLGSTVEVTVRAGHLSVCYAADQLDRADGLDLAVAEAVAQLHGGELVAACDDGSVELSLALEPAPPALRLVAA